MDRYEDVTCPFCKDTGFDLAGLKQHLAVGWCDAYNVTEQLNPGIRIQGTYPPPSETKEKANGGG